MADAPDPSSAPKQIPLPIAIGILAAVFLVGAGTIGYYMLIRPARAVKPIRTITPSPGNPRVARSGEPDRSANVLAAAREADLADGGYEEREGELHIKAGDAYVRLARRDGVDQIRLGFYSMSEQQWDHGYLSQGVRRILIDADLARKLDVSKEQIEKLEGLPPPPGDWPEADRKKLLDAFARWRGMMGSARTAAAQDMVPLLREIAQRKQSSDEQLITKRIAQIRSILTPRQIEAINPIPRWDIGK